MFSKVVFVFLLCGAYSVPFRAPRIGSSVVENAFPAVKWPPYSFKRSVQELPTDPAKVDNPDPITPFKFNIEVSDSPSSNVYSHSATFEEGNKQGEYRVLLPDGRTQIVNYYIDEAGGYNAKVKYEGTAKPYVPPTPRPSFNNQSSNHYSILNQSNKRTNVVNRVMEQMDIPQAEQKQFPREAHHLELPISDVKDKNNYSEEANKNPVQNFSTSESNNIGQEQGSEGIYQNYNLLVQSNIPENPSKQNLIQPIEHIAKFDPSINLTVQDSTSIQNNNFSEETVTPLAQNVDLPTHILSNKSSDQTWIQLVQSVNSSPNNYNVPNSASALPELSVNSLVETSANQNQTSSIQNYNITLSQPSKSFTSFEDNIELDQIVSKNIKETVGVQTPEEIKEEIYKYPAQTQSQNIEQSGISLIPIAELPATAYQQSTENDKLLQNYFNVSASIDKTPVAENPIQNINESQSALYSDPVQISSVIKQANALPVENIETETKNNTNLQKNEFEIEPISFAQPLPEASHPENLSQNKNELKQSATPIAPNNLLVEQTYSQHALLYGNAQNQLNTLNPPNNFLPGETYHSSVDINNSPSQSFSQPPQSNNVQIQSEISNIQENLAKEPSPNLQIKNNEQKNSVISLAQTNKAIEQAYQSQVHNNNAPKVVIPIALDQEHSDSKFVHNNDAVVHTNCTSSQKNTLPKSHYNQPSNNILPVQNYKASQQSFSLPVPNSNVQKQAEFSHIIQINKAQEQTYHPELQNGNVSKQPIIILDQNNLLSKEQTYGQQAQNNKEFNKYKTQTLQNNLAPIQSYRSSVENNLLKQPFNPSPQFDNFLRPSDNFPIQEVKPLGQPSSFSAQINNVQQIHDASLNNFIKTEEQKIRPIVQTKSGISQLNNVEAVQNYRPLEQNDNLSPESHPNPQEQKTIISEEAEQKYNSRSPRQSHFRSSVSNPRPGDLFGFGAPKPGSILEQSSYL